MQLKLGILFLDLPAFFFRLLWKIHQVQILVVELILRQLQLLDFPQRGIQLSRLVFKLVFEHVSMLAFGVLGPFE